MLSEFLKMEGVNQLSRLNQKKINGGFPIPGVNFQVIGWKADCAYWATEMGYGEAEFNQCVQEFYDRQ
ncbi:MAG: hypothetical protein L3J20_05935 [Flavobacteriaceae bacterium]|nr:hypothetical protein [Flavobacteriaceae bacterium]